MTAITVICTLVSLLFGYLAIRELKDGSRAGFTVMFILQVLSVACVVLSIYMPA